MWPVHPKGNQSWIFIGRTDVEAKAPILWPPDTKNWLWKRLWCWERWKAVGEGDDRGWDGWIASPTRWTWVWVSSGSWWWIGRPGVLQFIQSQSRTRLSNWTKLLLLFCSTSYIFLALIFTFSIEVSESHTFKECTTLITMPNILKCDTVLHFTLVPISTRYTSHLKQMMIRLNASIN